MKFSVSSTDLLKKLQLASGAISPNPVLPILEDFLFELDDKSLTVVATNLETSIITKVDVSSEEGGRLAVPARILLDTLKALPEQPISFVADVESGNIEVTSAYGKYKLAGENAEDFPEIPMVENAESIGVDSIALINAINSTVFATSTDELRLAMTGVYFQVDFNKVIFVATDAHKLVKYTYNNIESEITASFIAPKKGLHLLKNALDENGSVKMSFNKNNVFFSAENLDIVCRLVDAKYPDYNAVIPVNNPNMLAVNRMDLLNSLRRISIYANKTTNQVVLNIADASLTISAQDLDFSNEATEQLSCQYQGDPMTIGFNAKFLIEMLSVLESDEVRFELSTPNKAGILVPADANDHESLLMLVMPVMMSN